MLLDPIALMLPPPKKCQQKSINGKQVLAMGLSSHLPPAKVGCLFVDTCRMFDLATDGRVPKLPS